MVDTMRLGVWKKTFRTSQLVEGEGWNWHLLLLVCGILDNGFLSIDNMLLQLM